MTCSALVADMLRIGCGLVAYRLRIGCGLVADVLRIGCGRVAYWLRTLMVCTRHHLYLCEVSCVVYHVAEQWF